MNRKILPCLIACLMAFVSSAAAQTLSPGAILWQNDFESNAVGDSTGANPGVINGVRFGFPGGVVRDSETIAPFSTPNQYLELSPKNTGDRWGYRAIVTGVLKAAYVASPVGISFDFNESTDPGNPTIIGFGTGVGNANPDLNNPQGLLSLTFRNGVIGTGANTTLVSVGENNGSDSENPMALPSFTEGVAYRFAFITNFTDQNHQVLGADGGAFLLEPMHAAFWFFNTDTAEYSPRVVLQNNNFRALDNHVSLVFRHFSVPAVTDTQLMQTIYVDNFVSTSYAIPPVVWSGGGADSLWSNTNNWVGNIIPTNGDIAAFSGEANLNPENDLLADTLLAELLFQNTTSSFILSGNRILLAERIANISAVSQTVEMPLNFDSTVIATDNLIAGTTLALEGDITGFGGILKKGEGTLALSGTNDFGGSKIIDQGAVTVGGDQSGATSPWHLRGFGATSTTFGNAATSLAFDETAIIFIDTFSFIQAGHSAAVGGFQPQSITSSGVVNNDGSLFLGRSGSLTLNGGSWTQNGPADVSTQGGGLAALTINEGTFSYTNPAEFILSIMNSDNTRTRLNITGGTFVTGASIHNSQVDLSPLDNAYSDVILALGGTLRLSNNIPDLFTTAGANNRLLVNDGGGTIDTNGFDTALDVNITGDGSLTKAGAGTLTTTGINAYEGDTAVTGGTLVLSAEGLADASSVSVASGATVTLNFIGSDIIGALALSGAALPDGTYDATTHPDSLSGTGQLVVATPVAPTDTFASWAASLGLSGNPADDFDNDGTADSLEFVFGTDPIVATSGDATTISETEDNLIVVFTRDDRSKTSDLTLSVESGTDLVTWPQIFSIGTSTEESSLGVTVTPNDNGTDTIAVAIPKSGATERFAKIQISITNNN